MSAEGVAAQVAAELVRQHEKWGEQNHPDGTSAVEWVPTANMARAVCNSAASRGQVTWLAILCEEVYEAFAETEPDALRAELVQVAAVAQQWIAAIDRRVGL